MMSSSLITALLWAAALGSGLIAGIYFGFSTFIMKAFNKIEAPHTVAAMNSINEVITRSLFMPLFFGSTMVSLLLVIVAISNWNEAGSVIMLTAGLVYFFGMFVCTVIFNVPLNNRLAKIEATDSNVGQVWLHYRKYWTRWNHLRTVSSLITCALSIQLLTNA